MIPDIPTNPLTIPAGTVQRGARRVRPYLTGHLVADSTAPLLVWEHPYYPHYAFAPNEVEAHLVETKPGPRSKVFGPSRTYDVLVEGDIAPAAAQSYPEAPHEGMREHVLFRWSAMDTWLEEDEVVHTHPRSPYVRVDALASSRHVQVLLDGVTIADSHRPVALFETGMPTRFYMPRADVRMDLLQPTDTTSACPYKGVARYWSVRADGVELADAVWGYDTPLEEAHRIAGLVAFWPEKHPTLQVFVDRVRVGA